MHSRTMQTEALVNPLEVAIIDSAGYAPLHAVHDEAHRDALADDMRLHGWRGAPLVVLACYVISLTGVHRRAAAEAAGLEEIPGVDLEEIFEAHGLDLWELIGDNDEYSTASAYYDFSLVVAENLPADVIEAYGFDQH